MTEAPHSNPAFVPLPGKVEAGTKPAFRRSNQKVNVLVLLQALKRRWWQAGLLGILLALLVGIALWFLVPFANPLVYARVQIRDNLTGVWQGHPDPPLQRQTQIALIKDPFTLATVLRRPEVAELKTITDQPDPEEWLLKELRVDFPSGPELMQFSMSGDRPQELKKIVNAVREVFIQNYGDTTRSERQTRLKQLQDANRETKVKIDNLYEQLRKKAESGKDVVKETIEFKHKLNMELLEYTKKEITKVSADLRQYRTELKLALEDNSKNSPAIPNKLIEDALDKHPLVMPLIARYLEMQDLLAKTMQAAPANPRVAVIQKEIGEQQKKIEAKKLEMKPSIVEEHKAKYQSNREALVAVLQNKVKQHEETERNLLADVDRLVKASESLNSSFIQLEEERQQIAMLEVVRAKLQGTIEQLSAEKDAPERIRALNEPVITSIDKYSNKIRFTALGAIAVFLVSLLLVAFLESRTRRINSTEDVTDQFGLNVVGMVPAPPKRLGFTLNGKGDSSDTWQHLLTESVDSFRTQLLYKARANAHQILMISSADSGEGKTSLACHLALSLARSGLRTLLIDADLRNPSLHLLFDLELQPGLSEVMREAAPIDDALHRTSANGLWLMPAGVCSRRVTELLAQDRLKTIFNKLRQQFDYIIVDSSPILPVADPLLIAQHADGVVISLMRQVSCYRSVRDAVEKLHALNIHPLGAVINGTQPIQGYYNRMYAYGTLNSEAETSES